MNVTIEFFVSNDPESKCHTALMQNFHMVTLSDLNLTMNCTYLVKDLCLYGTFLIL